MSFDIFFTILGLIVLIDAPLVAWLMLVKNPKTVDIIGTTLSLLIVLMGVSISFILEAVVRSEFAGHSGESPLLYGLGFTAIAVAPLLTIMYMRLRTRGRQGHCKQCDYDLRGSKGSPTCPECGAPTLKQVLK